MSAVKEKILGAVTIMNDVDAAIVWDFIVNQFQDRSWENIEEVTPDEWDLKMLNEIKEDPDCHKFISFSEAMKQLGLWHTISARSAKRLYYDSYSRI